MEEALRQIGAFRADNMTGASGLSRRAAQILRAYLTRNADRTPREVQARLEMLLEAIEKAKPAMAPLRNLGSVVRAACATDGAKSALHERLEQALIAFLERLEAEEAGLAREGARLILDGAAIMTHSRSSAVESAIRLAVSRGKHITLYCTESRPAGEGRTLAEDLARIGVEVHLLIDAAIGLYLPAVSLVLVGGDALTPAGLVNKVGTTLLARAAQDAGKTLYATCGGSKILCEPLPYNFAEEQNDPVEITTASLPRLAVHNPYFEVTPLRHLTGVVTERGVTTGEALFALFSKPFALGESSGRQAY